MILALLCFLAWGSHLNSLGYRLLHLEHYFKARSFCTSCKNIIAWYDNIPLLSWLILKATCRHCKQPISWLYPFIEIITTCFLLFLRQSVSTNYFPAYFLFFSALIVTIRTDFEEMLISRFVTLYLIPAGLLAAIMNWLPISPILSIAGAIFGYFILWCAKRMSYAMTRQENLGQGDLELLAFIGAFTGPMGCWIALLIGSTFGTIASLIYMTITKKKNRLHPFRPLPKLWSYNLRSLSKIFHEIFFKSIKLFALKI